MERRQDDRIAPLLATKIRVPARPRHLVPRGRLIEWLEWEVPAARLTVVSAPAGYGKTTLLAEWARASRLPVAWLSLGSEDDHFERFFRTLLAAWEVAQPAVAESDLALLLGGMMPEPEAVLAAFVQAGHEAADVAFVLDDFHLSDDLAIQQAVAMLIDQTPPALHFVVAGRGEPPLPVARYRARAQLAELRAADLSFSPEEAAALLHQASGRDLSAEAVGRLHARIEGWAAGLQLVAVALRRGLTSAAESVVGGRHRFIADYLSQDVLVDLPAEMQDFLVETSILDRLSGALCDAVTGRAGGHEMLESLEREDLFLVPLDDGREWFRYHGLFGEFLQDQLRRRREPEEVRQRHRRAAAWHLAHGSAEEAFHHARAAEDADLLAAVFRRHFFGKLMNGEIALLQRWVAAVPDAWRAGRPVFNLARAGVLFFIGQVEAAGRCLDELEQELAAAEDAAAQADLASVTAVRCFIACGLNDLPRAEALAHEALARLPEQDELGLRTSIYGSLGDTYRQNARWDEARDSYRKMLAQPDAPPAAAITMSVYGALADLELRRGRLRDSAAYWQQALAMIAAPGHRGAFPLPLIGWVHIRLGEILYEWDDRPAAWDHLARGLRRAELGGDVRARVAGYLLAGRLHLAAGALEAAEAQLAQARPLIEGAQFAEWHARFERLQIELWLARDRRSQAAEWAKAKLAAGAAGRPAELETAELAAARALLLTGDPTSIAQALATAATLAGAAAAEGRAGLRIEALALEALGKWQAGAAAAAMAALEQALRLAEPEGYVRLFADLGRPMARLLQEARARRVMPPYVEALLAAAGAAPGRAAAALPELLTPREEEVLGLLAAGLTNREIAAALVISAETVKKHAGNIYGKLGAGNRTEAVARARELDLLS